MKGHRRTFAPVGLAGCIMLGLMPLGCGGGLGEVTVRQDPPGDRPALPPITVERLRQCVADYRNQLEPGRHWFNPRVQVDQDGFHREVSTDDIPRTAPDLVLCTRSVLRDMAIPSSILTLPPPEDAPTTNRTYMGTPAVIVVVVVVEVTEIVIEAGLLTVLFGVTVEVAHEAGKDIAEAARRPRWEKECLDHYVACVETPVYNDPGNHWSETRCGNCRDWCQQYHTWPPSVGNGSCEYWKRNWGDPSN